MASRKEYLDYILGQLDGLEGIYDDRFLVKPTPAARAMLPRAPEELPYEGAKAMLLVDNVEDRDFLARLVTAMGPELPAPKKKKAT